MHAKTCFLLKYRHQPDHVRSGTKLRNAAQIFICTNCATHWQTSTNCAAQRSTAGGNRPLDKFNFVRVKFRNSINLQRTYNSNFFCNFSSTNFFSKFSQIFIPNIIQNTNKFYLKFPQILFRIYPLIFKIISISFNFFF